MGILKGGKGNLALLLLLKLDCKVVGKSTKCFGKMSNVRELPYVCNIFGLFGLINVMANLSALTITTLPHCHFRP